MYESNKFLNDGIALRAISGGVTFYFSLDHVLTCVDCSIVTVHVLQGSIAVVSVFTPNPFSVGCKKVFLY